MSDLDALARAIAATPADETRWLVYADALSEAGRMPPFFAHALAGGHVPEPRFFGVLSEAIERGDLQLLFNRFHFIEAAWIRPLQADGYTRVLRHLLMSPLSRFLTQLNVAAMIGWSFEAAAERAHAEATLRVLTGMPLPWPALRHVSLGHSPQPVLLTDAHQAVATIRSWAPHFQTTPIQLVEPLRALQVRLIRREPEVHITRIAVDEVLPGFGPHVVGVPPAQGNPAGMYEVTSKRQVKGLCSFSNSASENIAYLRVFSPPVILCNTSVPERRHGYPLMAGDTIEIGPGVVFRVEATAT